jgi:hypothetical protein
MELFNRAILNKSKYLLLGLLFN